MTEPDNDKNSQDKFAQANPSPVLSSTIDGVLQFVNPAASKLLLELELEQIEDMLPTDHKGLVKACMNTRETLNEECTLRGRNIVWSYQSIDESSLVYIYGHDVSEYKSEVRALDVLPKANPNPVISMTVEGDVTYANPAVSQLLQDMKLENIVDALPHNHPGLLKACSATHMPLTEERTIECRTVAWMYKSFENSDEIYIYGHDLMNCNSKIFCTEDIPRENPSPVISTDVDGVLGFVNHATFRIIEELGLDKVEDILPQEHKGLIKACHNANTPLSKQHQVGGRTLVWSYHPVDIGGMVYIFGHDITDYCSNISDKKV